MLNALCHPTNKVLNGYMLTSKCICVLRINVIISARHLALRLEAIVHAVFTLSGFIRFTFDNL